MKPINTAWFCQIELTSRCFMSCLYCSRYNRHLRADQRYDMSLEVLGKALDSLKEWPTRIGIIGGEPILHRQFAECCALIQSKFPREKMGLWTSGGKDWPKYKELAEKTFGFIAYNEHSPEQKKVCRHQRLTVAVRDVVKDEQYMNELIDDCWVQRTWCPTISMKGAFFCEVAAAQDLLWDGPGGYPIEPNWWRKTPEQFKDQRDRYCQNCGMCIPMERDLIQCGIEKASPSVYARMLEHRNLRINLGEHIEIYDKQMSIDEVEANKLTWYPGNYRGDNHEDHSSPEGRGSTVWRKPQVNIHIMRPEGSPWHEGLRDLIRECLNPGTTMLEIGSFSGESALQFLESGKIDKLYVVDAWRNGLDMSDIHTSMVDLAEVERMFDNRVSAFGDRVVKIKGDSLLVHGEIPDKSLDFIYVDSCHAYEHLSQELRLYAPKLKAEAILGGHDYSNESYPGIKKAIDEFCGGPDRVFQDTSWIKHIQRRNFPMRVKIELMTMWYNEEFLAPFFLRHYCFVDKIHIFLDADTNDGTRNKIDQASALHKNIQVHEFKFPDKMDDIIKIGQFNTFYKTVDSDYVFLVDSDEFIFYPPSYLDNHPNIVHFTRLWNVYRHHTEQDLDPKQPIERQRRHGVSDFEGWDNYTKPNIVKAKQDFRWGLGHHTGYLNGQLVDWQMPHENFPPGVSRIAPLTGSHWAMADPAFVIERRIKGRKERQSQINLKHGLTLQHHKITEEAIRASLKQHENDPQVFWLTNEEEELTPLGEQRDSGQTGPFETKTTPTATNETAALPQVRPYEALPEYYRHVRPEIIAAVPVGAQNILDVGCAAGALGKSLKQQDPHRRVVGIELDNEAFHYMQQSLDAAYHADVEQFDPPFKPGEFDCIIFADILEHLKDPWNILVKYTKHLRPGGTIIVSIPNVRNLDILRDLAQYGSWKYADEGILDRTHLRFFTKKEFLDLLQKADIRIDDIKYPAFDKFMAIFPRGPKNVLHYGNLILLNITEDDLNELRANQIIFVGTYIPGYYTNGSLTSQPLQIDATLENRYQNIQHQIGLGQIGEPLKSLESLIKEVPDFALGHNDLGVLYLRTEKTYWAKAHFEKAIQLDPTNIVYLKNLGNYYCLFEKRLEDALLIYQSVISIKPDDKEALERIALIAVAMGKEKDAAFLSSKALKVNEIDPVIYEILKKTKDLHLQSADRRPTCSDAKGRRNNGHKDCCLSKKDENYLRILEKDPFSAYLHTKMKTEKIMVLNEADNYERPIKDTKKMTEVPEEISIKPKFLKGGVHSKLVSIVIPVFNCMEYTRKFLRALNQNTPKELYEVIIIDNGSTDQTNELLDNLNENIKIITNKSNLGFSKASNQGAKKAGAPFIVFLNNDTEPQPGWLQPMVELITNDNTIGAVGSKLIFPDQSIQHAGVVILNDNRVSPNLLIATHVHYQKPIDFAEANKMRTFKALTAACLLVRKSAFTEVGGFDEKYWNGYEDVDLCFKLYMKGWKLVYHPESLLIHHESKSGPERFSKTQSNVDRLQQRWAGKIKPDFVINKDCSIIPFDNQGIKLYDKIESHLEQSESTLLLRKTKFNKKRHQNCQIVLHESMQKDIFNKKISKNDLFCSVIIPAKDNWEYTRLCLDSLVRYADVPYELIIVDNGSSVSFRDQLSAWKKKNSRVRLKYLRSNKNLGFAGGCNKGIQISGGDFLVFLNNDTVVTPGLFSTLLKPLMEKEEVGITGPVSNFVAGAQMISINRLKFAGPEEADIEEIADYAHEIRERFKGRMTPTNNLVGLCLALKKEVVQTIGGFDERFYPGNFEDVDYCVRAVQKGFKLMICQDAFLYHFGNRTFLNEDGDYRYFLTVNLEKFLKKWGLNGFKSENELYEIPIANRTYPKEFFHYPITNEQQAYIYSPNGHSVFMGEVLKTYLENSFMWSSRLIIPCNGQEPAEIQEKIETFLEEEGLRDNGDIVIFSGNLTEVLEGLEGERCLISSWAGEFAPAMTSDDVALVL